MQPIASASIAQVHVAKLRTGEEVVVKVVRPDLKPVIERCRFNVFDSPFDGKVLATCKVSSTNFSCSGVRKDNS